VKVHVPLHLTDDWILRDISRERIEREQGKPRTKINYVKPKPISIRQFIARAEKLKTL